MTASFNNLKVTQIDNYGFNDIEIEILTNRFLTIVRKLEPSALHKAWLELVSANIDSNNTLLMLITFKATNDKKQWQAVVYDKEKVLIITAVCE